MFRYFSVYVAAHWCVCVLRGLRGLLLGGGAERSMGLPCTGDGVTRGSPARRCAFALADGGTKTDQKRGVRFFSLSALAVICRACGQRGFAFLLHVRSRGRPE